MKNRLIVGLIVAATLTACSGGDGGGTSREDLLKLAGESVPAEQPTTTPEAQIEVTVTPDVYLPQPAPQIAPTATPDAPAAMPEPTAAPVVAQDLQTLAVIGAVCDPYTARPMALDDDDRRGGVVTKGGGCVEVVK